MVGAIAQKQDRALFGIILMVIAYLIFSFIDVSAKWLAIAGLPAMQLAFMRYVGHMAISTGLLVRDGDLSSLFRTKYLLVVMFRGSLLMGSTILNFIAVQYLPLTLTSTILFSAPIIICLLSWPLLGEKVGYWRWSAIMLGFIGILVTIRPFDSDFHFAAFYSLGGAFCFALYSILTRRLAGEISVDVMQFHSGFVGTVVLLPFAILSWQSPNTMMDWAIMIMLGVFGWMGHQLLTHAHSFAAANVLTPFGYSFILFLTTWSYLVFDHLPDIWTVIGASIIITSGLIIWFREMKKAKVMQP
ncbi:DMT family transporter [Alphaproteobacteria bacterium]|nr:DMT family transporter [Alphaproteobacteria bacterium]